MTTYEEIVRQSEGIEQKLGYIFKEKKLLALAFVHRSYFNENRNLLPEHNERLEFLGDSVLGLLISDFLYTQLPGQPEGELSRLRSQIVDAAACADYLNRLGLGEFVLLGKGERSNDGKGRETIMADLFEAIIGAIYLDGGYGEAGKFFFGHFRDQVFATIKEPMRNWKAELQDLSQKKYQKPPVYKVVKESGPDHSKVFDIVVLIDGKEMGSGTGSTKKEAEQAAAAVAVKELTHV
jgi:ribonuclease-3